LEIALSSVIADKLDLLLHLWGRAGDLRVLNDVFKPYFDIL
jgi:hypothetical protein